MEPMGSITHWIHAARAGEELAAQKLWERYFGNLVRLASRKLAGFPRRAADEHDVAIAAFESFCLGARDGRYPRLEDRQGLWRLLVRITAYKAIDQIKRECRDKRGGGKVLGAGELGAADSNGSGGLEGVVGREPTPEFAASLAEEFTKLLEGLGDPVLREVAVWKMEGWSNAEIAAKLGCGERTVSRKLDLIRKLLQERRGG
jgi:DNA-directed RNA polymerase specialized sigma24 family protein